jgi:hypothetical protein
LFKTPAYDRTVLDPEVVEIAFPSIEGRAVEEGNSAHLSRCASAERKRRKNKYRTQQNNIA